MKLPLTTNLKSDKEKESETMKEALKHIINDAYERGKLDAELGVSTNLSLLSNIVSPLKEQPRWAYPRRGQLKSHKEKKDDYLQIRMS